MKVTSTNAIAESLFWLNKILLFMPLIRIKENDMIVISLINFICCEL